MMYKYLWAKAIQKKDNEEKKNKKKLKSPNHDSDKRLRLHKPEGGGTLEIFSNMNTSL
jgi:hypothetical protein